MIPYISIITIAESWNDFLAESLPYYQYLNYDRFEVLVITSNNIPSEKILGLSKRIKFLVSPETKNNPAEKRDLSIKHAKGDILAFIDDDAWPDKEWLINAVENFTDESVIAVGGPGITPSNASKLEKAGGFVSASPLGGFGNTYRFIPQKRRIVNDYPSCNFLVRKSDFISVNGFDSNYYPGEDTKLCLDLIKKTGKIIVYDPNVRVYHHKRPLFKKYLIQNGRFGEHRGHFAKILPDTSALWFYFIPSLFTIGLAGGLVVSFLYLATQNGIFGILTYIYICVLGLYTLLLFANFIVIYKNSKCISISLLASVGVLLTHVWYGYKFILGYFKQRLNDKYGRIEN